MLLAILSICSREELDESDSDEGDAQTARLSEDDLAARRQLIKKKILAVGKMQKVFQLLRCVSCSLPPSYSPLLLYAYYLYAGALNREEAENASELEAGSSTAVSRPGVDGLSVNGTRINRSIRSFADA